jgi:hypothetical protein
LALHWITINKVIGGERGLTLWRWFRITGLLIALSSGALVAVRVAAMQRSDDAVREAFHAAVCTPQPCFYSIYPGRTTLAEAEQLLENAPGVVVQRTDTNICWTSKFAQGCLFPAFTANRDAAVTQINFNTGNSSVTLGDVLTAFGQPILDIACRRTIGNLTDTMTKVLILKQGIEVQIFLYAEHSAVITSRIATRFEAADLFFRRGLKVSIYRENNNRHYPSPWQRGDLTSSC